MLQGVESGTSITKAIALPSGAHFASVGVSVRRVTWDDAPSASIQRTKIWVPLGSPSAKYRMRVPSGDHRASDPFTRKRWCDPSGPAIQRADSHLSSILLTQRRVYTICEPLPVEIVVDREQGVGGGLLGGCGPGDERGRDDDERTAKKFEHQRAAFAPPVRLSLTTWPPFITNPTCSSTVTSWSGSPATPITSANLPGSSAPTRSAQPIRSAALTVAAWIACSGVVPDRTMCANCFAFQPWGYTPASVPNAIFTPACTAFLKFSRCWRPTRRSFSMIFAGKPRRVYSAMM